MIYKKEGDPFLFICLCGIFPKNKWGILENMKEFCIEKRV